MKFLETWWIRKASYAVASVIALVMAGFGIIGETQTDAVTNSINTVVFMLLGLVLSVTTAKTNRGSDDKTTVADLDNVGVKNDFIGHVGRRLERQERALNDVLAQVKEAAKHDYAGGTEPGEVPTYPGGVR